MPNKNCLDDKINKIGVKDISFHVVALIDEGGKTFFQVSMENLFHFRVKKITK